MNFWQRLAHKVIGIDYILLRVSADYDERVMEVRRVRWIDNYPWAQLPRRQFREISTNDFDHGLAIPLTRRITEWLHIAKQMGEISGESQSNPNPHEERYEVRSRPVLTDFQRQAFQEAIRKAWTTRLNG